MGPINYVVSSRYNYIHITFGYNVFEGGLGAALARPQGSSRPELWKGQHSINVVCGVGGGGSGCLKYLRNITLRHRAIKCLQHVLMGNVAICGFDDKSMNFGMVVAKGILKNIR